MRNKKSLLLGLIVGLIVILSFSSISQTFLKKDEIPNENSEQSYLQLGYPAPDFELNALKRVVRLSDLQGKVVLVNFWATWCGPCTIEMPLFQRFHEDHSNELVILAINGQDTLEDIILYSNELGLTFDVLVDKDGKVHNQYLVRGFPTTIILNREGIVQFQHIGILNKDQLTRYLDSAGL